MIQDVKKAQLRHAIDRIKEVNQFLFTFNDYVRQNGITSSVEDDPEGKELIEKLTREINVAHGIVTEGFLSQDEI